MRGGYHEDSAIYVNIPVFWHCRELILLHICSNIGPWLICSSISLIISSQFQYPSDFWNPFLSLISSSKLDRSRSSKWCSCPGYHPSGRSLRRVIEAISLWTWCWRTARSNVFKMIFCHIVGLIHSLLNVWWTSVIMLISMDTWWILKFHISPRIYFECYLRFWRNYEMDFMSWIQMLKLSGMIVLIPVVISTIKTKCHGRIRNGSDVLMVCFSIIGGLPKTSILLSY